MSGRGLAGPQRSFVLSFLLLGKSDGGLRGVRWFGVGTRSYRQVSLLYETISDPTESFTATTVGLVLYGVTIFQYLFYFSAFPNDKRLLKIVVLLVFTLDTFGTITLLSYYCRELIVCRWQTSYACTVGVPWYMSSALGANFFTAFFVQWFDISLTPLVLFSLPDDSFYAHRVWIIGNRNKLLTGAVLVTSLAQLAFGLALLGMVYHTGIIDTLFSSPYSPLNALGSAICDAIITASIFFYLRPLSGRFRKENHIRKLNLVFVQMGLITFLVSLAMAILYYQDHLVGKYLTVAPGGILGKTYSNSMLAVLNARKSIRDQQQAQVQPLEIPTLPSIH
ncbi:hypothetical protein F5J12DRAFT_928033 [Pisolithus orientalis]|uniref:uncharacterized protein n=1 Tax=Pisolithus orientalis TaxID=936130 RepID=UPI002224950E|nr:uncharacterized protein F5J12DRAFT_928033 [Pisolithus orientalis]KAI6003195.1 hypothetical protein F5J12DRAFT_928033 [Pisolithus orientalis]